VIGAAAGLLLLLLLLLLGYNVTSKKALHCIALHSLAAIRPTADI